MASLATTQTERYPPTVVYAHYDPEVDIALLSFEQGYATSEEHPWGLIDRAPNDGHLMGFEIWDASHRLPRELLKALPAPKPTAHAS